MDGVGEVLERGSGDKEEEKITEIKARETRRKSNMISVNWATSSRSRY